MHTSLLARIAAGVAALAALAFAGMPLAVRLDWLTTLVGFRIFMLGGLLGILALGLGLAALYTTRAASGRSGRGAALAATGIGAAILVAIGVAAGPGAGLPPINDITTDPDDPPRFAALAEVEANAGRDMGYPGEEFARQQREAYPDLAPIALSEPPRRALARVAAAAEDLGWEVVRRDPERGELEATETSRVWHFVDDVSVRVRPDDGGSRVDVRSKSREGLGDLGANAERIRRLRAALD